jgi:protein phosphatase
MAGTDAGGNDAVVCAVVADGMGGHAAGEVASQLAAETVVRAFGARLSEGSVPGDQLVRAMEDAFDAANRVVYEQAQRDPEHAGMGTTLTAALVRDGSLVAGHVGDSRLYLVRRGRVQQLTRDHSYQRMLTRVIGTDPEVKSDSLLRTLRPGDLLLLATDGAYRSLSDDDLLHAIGTNKDPQAACDDLVARARKRSGSDDLTVVCVAPDGTWPKAPPPPPPNGIRTLLKSALAVTLALIAVVVAQIVRSSRPARPQPGPTPQPHASPGLANGLLQLELSLSNGQVAVTYRRGPPLWLSVGHSTSRRLAPGSKPVTVRLSPGRAGSRDQRVVLKVDPPSGEGALWRFARYPDPGADDLPEPLRQLRLDGKPTSLKRDGAVFAGQYPWPVERVEFNLAGEGGLPVKLTFAASPVGSPSPTTRAGTEQRRAGQPTDARRESDRGDTIDRNGAGEVQQTRDRRRPEDQQPNR